MSFTDAKTRIIRFLNYGSSDMAEVMLACSKIIIGMALLLGIPTYYMAFIGGGVAVQMGVTGAVGVVAVGMGIMKFLAWVYQHKGFRTGCAMLGFMLWLFLATLQILHQPSITFVVYLFVLFAATDAVIYLRLRHSNGH